MFDSTKYFGAQSPDFRFKFQHQFYSYATSKGAELSCELDYAISFWLWISLWKSPHFVEISTFRGYYPHSVEISTLRGYYPHFVDIYVFHGYYPHFMEISMFRRYYLHFMEISTSRGYYPNFVGIIRIGHITSYLARNFVVFFTVLF